MWGYQLALTDTICKNAKPKEKPYKLADSGGLYLHVMPNGARYWRLKYRINSKEKLLALGTYPFVTLAEAREERESAKKLLSKSIDPSETKRDQKKNVIRDATNTFKAVALEWVELKKETWSESYHLTVLQRLNKDIFPFIGKDKVDTIEAPDLLIALKRMEKREALDLASRCRSLCVQIFRYAIQTGKCKNNPAADLQGAIKSRRTKHFAAISPKEIPELLKALDNNDARLYPRTRRAIKLSMLTFVRPGELRQAMWDEIDFDKKVWVIPAERMKSRREHIVPLSDQAIEILIQQKEETGRIKTKYVFPSQINPNEPMSDGTVRVALQKLGFRDRMTAHGFRALARTAIREELEYDPDIIEAQLAHKPIGALGAAYDRSQFIKKRQMMMQQWADYLEALL